MKMNLKKFNKNINTVFYPELNYSTPSLRMTFIDFMFNNNLISNVNTKELDSFFSNKEESIMKLNFALNNMSLTTENQCEIPYIALIQTLLAISPNIPWNKFIPPDKYEPKIGVALIFYTYIYNFYYNKGNKNDLYVVINHLSKLENKIPYQLIKSLFLYEDNFDYLLPIHMLPILYSLVNKYSNHNSYYLKVNVFGKFPKDSFDRYGLYIKDVKSFTSHLFDKLHKHYYSVLRDELS